MPFRFNDKGGQVYGLMEPFLGNGLLTSNGDRWRHRRKLLTPSFHFQILQDFLPAMNKQAEKFVHEILPPMIESSGGEAVDVTRALLHFSLDVLCEAATGQDLGI